MHTGRDRACEIHLPWGSSGRRLSATEPKRYRTCCVTPEMGRISYFFLPEDTENRL